MGVTVTPSLTTYEPYLGIPIDDPPSAPSIPRFDPWKNPTAFGVPPLFFFVDAFGEAAAACVEGFFFWHGDWETFRVHVVIFKRDFFAFFGGEMENINPMEHKSLYQKKVTIRKETLPKKQIIGFDQSKFSWNGFTTVILKKKTS